MPGIELLRQIKAREETRDIPVVILAMSENDRDIIECGRLGAENYLVKPYSFEGLTKVTPRLNLHWALLKAKR
jgi:two-component system, response regulator